MAAKSSRSVTLKHLAASLAKEHDMSKRAGQELLHELIGLITRHLKKGERIRIAGLGILQVRHRAARMGRNPATGEPIQIKAGKKVAFRASKELKLVALPQINWKIPPANSFGGGVLFSSPSRVQGPYLFASR